MIKIQYIPELHAVQKQLAHKYLTNTVSNSIAEIKLATMMSTAFQPPILYIPPPPPVEEDQVFDFKSSRNNVDPSYYNELSSITNNYAAAVIPQAVKASVILIKNFEC